MNELIALNLSRNETVDILLALNAVSECGEKWQKLHDKVKEQLLRQTEE